MMGFDGFGSGNYHFDCDSDDDRTLLMANWLYGVSCLRLTCGRGLWWLAKQKLWLDFNCSIVTSECEGLNLKGWKGGCQIYI